MRFIVTAGPTREYLDDVRFLTNASSGRMGYAVARAAAKRGHSVHLVAGPVALEDPPGVRVHRVTSTREMYEAAAKLFPRADCLIGAADPADFTPVRRVKGKMKKSRPALALQLRPTVDITRRRCPPARAPAGRDRLRPRSPEPLAEPRLKLRRKHADAIGLNPPAQWAR